MSKYIHAGFWMCDTYVYKIPLERTPVFQESRDEIGNFPIIYTYFCLILRIQNDQFFLLFFFKI